MIPARAQLREDYSAMMIGISQEYSREAVFLKTLCLLFGKRAPGTVWMEKWGRTVLLGCYSSVANKSSLLANHKI